MRTIHEREHAKLACLVTGSSDGQRIETFSISARQVAAQLEQEDEMPRSEPDAHDPNRAKAWCCDPLVDQALMAMHGQYEINVTLRESFRSVDLAVCVSAF